MSLSSRMKWTIPSEDADPWYDALVALIGQQDAAAYAGREDRNIVLMGGGTISWQASTGILAWTEPLRVFSPVSGFQCLVSAGHVQLDQSGKLMHAPLVRYPAGGNKTVVAAVASQVPDVSPNDQILFAIRYGDFVYWRNGLVLADGAVCSNFQVSGFVAGGDLSGNSTSQEVIGIRSRAVSATAPTVGQVYKWSGTEWVPAADAAGSSTPMLVFRPGGVASGNVYTDWSLLMAALGVIEGPRVVEIDSSLAGPGYATIPSGIHAFGKDTVLRGKFASTLVLADGAVLQDVFDIEGSLDIYSASSAAVFSWTGSKYLTLHDRVSLYGATTYGCSYPLIYDAVNLTMRDQSGLYASGSAKNIVYTATGTSTIDLFDGAYIGGGLGLRFAIGIALKTTATGIIEVRIFSQGAYLQHAQFARVSWAPYCVRQLVIPLVKTLAIDLTGVPSAVGAAYVSYQQLPKHENLKCYFRVVMETTSDTIGYEAYVDLFDVHGQLNTGTPAVVFGSQMDTGSADSPIGAPTPDPLVPSVYEVDLTTAIVAGTWVSDGLVLEARLWIGTSAESNVATCKSAELVFEWTELVPLPS